MGFEDEERLRSKVRGFGFGLGMGDIYTLGWKRVIWVICN